VPGSTAKASADGLEMTFATNYLVISLTHLLGALTQATGHV
jgi:hypothetical protein